MHHKPSQTITLSQAAPVYARSFHAVVIAVALNYNAGAFDAAPWELAISPVTWIVVTDCRSSRNVA